MIVGKAYKDNQYKFGRDARHPSAKAQLVVNVVMNTLNPTSSIVFWIRSTGSFVSSVLANSPKMTKASSNPIPKTIKGRICVVDVNGIPVCSNNE